MVREVEPAKPSTRLSALGATRATVATNRRTDAKRLGQQLSGELDWIVMRAMEKDRSRRYETAAALADDLGRYLAGEAVLAGPASGLYRARRLVRRHRAAAGVGAAVAACLVAGVAGTAVGFVREAAARRVAQAQRALAERRQHEAEAERDGARAAVSYVTHDVLDAAVRQQPHDAAAPPGARRRPDPPGRAGRGRPLPRPPARGGGRPRGPGVGAGRRRAGRAGAGPGRGRPGHPPAVPGNDDRDTIRAEVLTAYLGKPGSPGTVQTSRDAYDQARRSCGTRDPVTLWAEFTYACALNWAGRSTEALPLIREAYEGQQAVLGPDPVVHAAVARGLRHDRRVGRPPGRRRPAHRRGPGTGAGGCWARRPGDDLGPGGRRQRPDRGRPPGPRPPTGTPRS